MAPRSPFPSPAARASGPSTGEPSSTKAIPAQVQPPRSTSTATTSRRTSSASPPRLRIRSTASSAPELVVTGGLELLDRPSPLFGDLPRAPLRQIDQHQG